MSKGGVKVKGRRQQRREEEIPLQTDLDREYRPIFEQYEESGGIPLGVLRRKLVEQGAGSLPPGKMELLLQRADENADGHLNYDEFCKLVSTPEMKGRQLTRWQSMVRGAVSSVVPNTSRTPAGTYIVEDYVDHYNCRPPPLFMIFISIVQLVIFIVYAVELKGTRYEVTATSGCPLYSPFIFNPSRRYEAWRFLTYMFIHNGALHLVFNLIFQLVLGIPLEMVHKWWRMGIVYLLGVIAGSLCHTVFDVSTLLAGASGGCYALIGAHFAIVIMNWKEMTHDWMSGPVKFVSSAPFRLFFWTLLAGFDIGLAIYKRYTDAGDQNIGYAAHLGGAMAGLLIGIPVLKNIDEKPWEKVVWWVAIIVYLLCVIFAVCWNIFIPKFPETDWRPCCPMPKY